MLFLTPSQQCHSTEGKFSFRMTTTTVLQPFFRDHLGEPVLEENFWTLCCKGLTEADHPAGRHSIRTKQCPPPPSPRLLQAACPSCCPTDVVKALKANGTDGARKWHVNLLTQVHLKKIAIKDQYTLPVSTHGPWTRCPK